MATAGKVIKCKAAVAWEPNKPLVIEEIEVAPPQKNEIRIKVAASGMCHSDLYYLFEAKNSAGFPIVLGHEGAGVVESVGPGVTEFKPGDKVIPLGAYRCGECRLCKNPETNMCEKCWSNIESAQMSSSDTRFSCRGKPVLQFVGTSTFSEYTVLNQIAVTKIHPDARLDRVCLFACSFCTGYGAAVNTAKVCAALKVQPGSVCAVFGMGAVGLAAVMGCKSAGASRIIAVDINEEKFEKAKIFGATDFVNPKAHQKPISEVLIEMTNGGVDYSLECVGDVTVMRSALESVVKGWGVAVIVGWNNVEDVSTRPVQLIAGRSMFGGYIGKESIPKLVLDHMAGRLNLDEFVTHTVKMDKINDVVELMKKGKCIRAIINISK